MSDWTSFGMGNAKSGRAGKLVTRALVHTNAWRAQTNGEHKIKGDFERNC